MFPIISIYLFVYFLSLSLWIGGISFAMLIALPAIHRCLISRAAAGELVRHILLGLNRVEVSCFGFLLGVSAIFCFLREPLAWHPCHFWLVAAMGLLTGFYRFYLTPRMEQMRQQIAGFYDMDRGDQRRRPYRLLHRIYVYAMTLNLLLGVLLLFFSVLSVAESS